MKKSCKDRITNKLYLPPVLPSLHWIRRPFQGAGAGGGGGVRRWFYYITNIPAYFDVDPQHFGCIHVLGL